MWNFRVSTVAILLLTATVVYAADFYVRDGASGSNNGSDWANAWENMTNINWSSVARGDTIFVADGTYTGDRWDKAASGTTPITIKKAIESDHGAEPGWQTTYGDGTATFEGQIEITTGYWVFDGQKRDSLTTGHGFKLDLSPSSKGLRLSAGPGGHTFRYIEIDGNDDNNTKAGDGIYSCCGEIADDITMQFLYVHDNTRTNLLTTGADRWLIEHSVFSRPGANQGQHSEIFSCKQSDDFVLRYNYFTDPISTGGVLITGLRWKIYGNVFTNTALNTRPCNNGMIGGWSGKISNNHQVYNNTFIDLDQSQGDLFPINAGQSSTVQNNLTCNMEEYANNASTKSHNAFSNSPNPGESNQQIIAGSCEALFVTYGSEFWQPATDDFRLEAETSPGVTLAAEFNTDMDGNVRGADGTWTRGAFEFVSGGVSTSSIGGNVTGLSSTMQGLELDCSGDDILPVENGSFTCPTLKVEGTSYDVTVSTQPTNPIQDCVVASGSGTVPAPDVTGISVTCSAVTTTTSYNDVVLSGVVLE
jgi:hypothetical protein